MKAILAICLAFVISVNGIVFDCTFIFKTGGYVGEVYTCYAIVSKSENSRILESVHGVHKNGRNLQDVRALQVENQVMNSFPKNLNSFFTDLMAIWFIHSNLLQLSADDLKPYPNLKELGMFQNKLKVLDGDLFKYTRNLNWIYFNENLIQQVGYDLLSGMNELKYALFGDNICVNIVATTPAKIEDLNRQLPVLCRCSVRCSIGSDVDRLETQLDNLSTTTKIQNDFQTNLVESLEKKVEELNELFIFTKIQNELQAQLVERLEDKVEEIEKKLREYVSIIGSKDGVLEL